MLLFLSSFERFLRTNNLLLSGKMGWKTTLLAFPLLFHRVSGKFLPPLFMYLSFLSKKKIRLEKDGGPSSVPILRDLNCSGT
jgi:hypothetical protein